MRFYLPVRIIWNDLFTSFSEIPVANSVVIVTGKHFAKEYGYIEMFMDMFSDADLYFYDNISPNPTVDNVEDLKTFLQEKNPEMVIGFGGGSVLDASKLAASLMHTNISIEDVFYFRKNIEKRKTIFVAIPTTTGTGSEVTQYSVLTHNNDKHGVASDYLFPDYAVLWVDPVMKQPKDLLIDSTVDALSHVIEGYLSERNKGVGSEIALSVIKNIYEVLPQQTEFITKSGMGILQNNAAFGGVVIAQRGTLLLHAAGYPLTVNHGLSHGRANLLLLPAFLILMQEKGVDIDPILDAMNIKHSMQLYDWYSKMGVETSFDYYGISLDNLYSYVEEVLTKKNLLITPGAIGEEDVKYMYEVAYENG